ncbi:hypothetical protein Syun_008094 [Stephania yunnanensis]|uniref:pectinesterase n=1 Tax=Stephania yunnanensis TaxID=152371 RepID=A0AAP0PZF1_9MAGN
MSSEMGDFDQNVAPWKLATALISKQIIVSKQRGYGHYTTVQAAIDHGNQMNIVRGVEDQARQRAVAAHVGGNKIAFIQCSFMGIQDTLFDDFGRHYFYKCRIEGYVDFIFGSGQSVYEGCHIYTYLGDSNYSGPGYITAQRRNSRNDPNGLWKEIQKPILGGLGVLIPGSSFSSQVSLMPLLRLDGLLGITLAKSINFMYAEMNCYGPGANRSQRVKWEKHLTQQQAKDLLGNGFINSDGWLDQGTLVYFNCSGDIFNATLSVKASNFFARKMVFKNPMNKVRRVEDVNNERQQAVAAQIGGDKVAFDHCSFLGIQDTLFDDFGRHYFYKCYIEGYVDFIFGSGQSIYEGCHIYVTTGDSEYSGAGFITANRRNNVNDSSGFVFSHCIVEGNAQAYLGRPWGPFSRVFFFQSNFSSVVDPSGWDAWKYVSQEHQLMFAEMNCYGPGADISRRVKWEKQLTLKQAHRLVGNGFMNSDGWLGQLPIPLKLGDN